MGCGCGSNGDPAKGMLRKVGWAHMGLGWREPAQDCEQGVRCHSQSSLIYGSFG